MSRTQLIAAIVALDNDEPDGKCFAAIFPSGGYNGPPLVKGNHESRSHAVSFVNGFSFGYADEDGLSAAVTFIHVPMEEESTPPG